MNIAQHIAHWRGGVSTASISNDINDEFEFHMDCRANELAAQGWATDAARAEAKREFGDRAAFEKHCRMIQRGPQAWFMRLAALSVLICAVVIGWTVYSMQVLRSQNKALVAKLETALAGNVLLPTPASYVSVTMQETKSGLTGKVTDDKGSPIKGAKVYLIHKSWPNQRFTMDTNETETNDEGVYSFEDLFSPDMQNAFHVTVLADAFEMKSDYEVFKAKKKVSAFDFKLKPAKAINFTFVDDTGTPLADTDIVLLSRKVGTKEHQLYAASAEDAKKSTDDKGVLTISNLQPGDTATFGIFIFNELENAELKITGDDHQTVTLQKKR